MRARARQGIASWQITLAAALFFLGFFIAAQVRAEAPAATYTSQERPALIQSIRGLQSQHDNLTSQIASLRKQIDSLRQGGQGGQSELDVLNAALKDAQLGAGFVPIQGAGGYVFVGDGTPPAGSNGNPDDYRIDASDLRTLVDSLWQSGAQAIAINRERVVTSTAILDVGGAILVNSAYVTEPGKPYVISYIGRQSVWDGASSTDSFRLWMRQRYMPYKLSLQHERNQQVFMLGYAGSANLRVGRVPAASSSAASPSAPASTTP